MSMNKGTLNEINRVAGEVLTLVDIVTHQINEQTTTERTEEEYGWRTVRKHSTGFAPDDATPDYPGTKDTAALRRRSMDLTRLLAEMRRAQ